MTDQLDLLSHLRRPALLIRAARHGVTQYNRNLHLRRLLLTASLPTNGPALTLLMDIEDDLDHQRKEDRASYSCARHIEVLIAMMGEARLLRTSTDNFNVS
ncbi:hypothetical protein TG4357_00161 [Thalassovita gelatinovora]|uniref:Uncharacterized protein n=1 Tax=Thalassovita gelatinovora TaxID=53501 RepID=A0A0N7LU52_THAGE|nr:DUF6477 family protein [Thalassovita gelatinovora]QIZ79300.1 hypothetical protein HFZ77_01850 [Thalassovita gelatinovora]CUH62530.1 hypothetical protein TG4357_00161 [Thalassovita gelatinovora]SEQ06038.1 hypothetical protein SAMN04488043_10361 [Thalassovita gelatinovora]